MVFQGGFFSFGVSLGGLTRFVRIEDVHGIPSGPLLERYFGDVLRDLDAPLGAVPPKAQAQRAVGIELFTTFSGARRGRKARHAAAEDQWLELELLRTDVEG